MAKRTARAMATYIQMEDELLALELPTIMQSVGEEHTTQFGMASEQFLHFPSALK